MDKTLISKELLLQNGWKLNEGDEALIAPIEKNITHYEEGMSDEQKKEQDEEMGKLCLFYQNFHNDNGFCLSIPGGGTLRFSPQSMEELNLFERMIDGFEPIF